MRSNASFGFEHNGTAGDGHGLRLIFNSDGPLWAVSH